ncbi:hypothetical protein [Candidatus Uabimicrobium sp. HlEnr_7]|uniref:hypothetical protein n=1 Tax=Candidatus Uabimicrobium helgolandensis TaxID=3095367 RepID=UPI0035576499
MKTIKTFLRNALFLSILVLVIVAAIASDRQTKIFCLISILALSVPFVYTVAIFLENPLNYDSYTARMFRILALFLVVLTASSFLISIVMYLLDQRIEKQIIAIKGFSSIITMLMASFIYSKSKSFSFSYDEDDHQQGKAFSDFFSIVIGGKIPKKELSLAKQKLTDAIENKITNVVFLIHARQVPTEHLRIFLDLMTDQKVFFVAPRFDTQTTLINEKLAKESQIFDQDQKLFEHLVELKREENNNDPNVLYRFIAGNNVPALVRKSYFPHLAILTIIAFAFLVLATFILIYPFIYRYFSDIHRFVIELGFRNFWKSEFYQYCIMGSFLLAIVTSALVGMIWNYGKREAKEFFLEKDKIRCVKDNNCREDYCLYKHIKNYDFNVAIDKGNLHHVLLLHIQEPESLSKKIYIEIKEKDIKRIQQVFTEQEIQQSQIRYNKLLKHIDI